MVIRQLEFSLLFVMWEHCHGPMELHGEKNPQLSLRFFFFFSNETLNTQTSVYSIKILQIAQLRLMNFVAVFFFINEQC